jgi:hypothetical protein
MHMAKTDHHSGAVHAQQLDGATAQAPRHDTVEMCACADPLCAQRVHEQVRLVAGITRHGQAAPHAQALLLRERGEAHGIEVAIRDGEVAAALGGM